MSDSSQKKYATVRISGMTCASCELLIERKILALPGVLHVDVHYASGFVHIIADAKNIPTKKRIADVIEKAGYTLVDENASTHMLISFDQRKWMEIGASLLIIFALYKILQTFNLVTLAPSTSNITSLGGVFIIGLVAGTSSCLAVTGGLLLALAAKHNEVHQSRTSWHKFRPLLHFNIGRLVSYFVLGGLIGLLGQTLTLTTTLSGYMNILVAFIMLYLALTILGIVPKGSFPIRPPKRLSRWITRLSANEHPAAPFTLGAFTFFLPCGFTQSLQFAALASGSFFTGSTMMFVFALGTLPSLLGVSAISATTTGAFSRMFLRFSGTLVLLLALFNLQSGLALTGIDITQTFARSGVQTAGALPPIRGGMQDVRMNVTSTGYEPRNLTIKAGVPVRWSIDGTEAYGCTSVMTIPSLGITKPLVRGTNIIEFTAPNTGTLAFMCSMGMVTGSFSVL